MNITDYYWAKSLAGGGGSGSDTEQLKELIDGTITHLVIPDGVTQIGGDDYDEWGSTGFRLVGLFALETVEMGDAVTLIKSGAFRECYNLQSIDTLNSVEEIEEFAFFQTGLESIELNSIETIGEYAFRECNSLTSVTIGENIVSIGAYAFYQLNLENPPETMPHLAVTIKATTPPELGQEAFSYENTEEMYTYIYVPAESVDTYKAAENWSDYAEYIFAIEE